MATTLTDSDNFVLADSLSIQLGNPFDREVGDNLFLSDSAQFLVSLLSAPTDALSLSDSLIIEKSIALALADQLSFSDSLLPLVEAVQIRLALSDALSFSDILSTTTSSGLDQYLRRYLNDVG